VGSGAWTCAGSPLAAIPWFNLAPIKSEMKRVSIRAIASVTGFCAPNRALRRRVSRHLNPASFSLYSAALPKKGLRILFLASLIFGICADLLAQVQTIYEPYCISPLAGLPPNSTDGTGTMARLDAPFGMSVDSAGNIYVADANNSTIRKITPAGVTSTLAGLAGHDGSADGVGDQARFFFRKELQLTVWGTSTSSILTTIQFVW
jgi:NHL repeat.